MKAATEIAASVHAEIQYSKYGGNFILITYDLYAKYVKFHVKSSAGAPLVRRACDVRRAGDRKSVNDHISSGLLALLGGPVG